MGVVSRLVRLSAVGIVVIAAALGTTACTTPSPTSKVAPTTGAAAPATARASAGPIAAGLVELARLGRHHGAGADVRSAAGTLLAAAESLTAALGADDVPPSVEVAAQLRDLSARAAADLDPAWLRTASDLLVEVRIAAYEVLAAPDTPQPVKDAVRDSMGRLDDARAALAALGSAAGAAPPTTVEAGDGGWANTPSASTTIAGIALVGLGGAMLGGALARRKARR